MKNLLSLYTHDYPRTPEKMNELIEEIELQLVEAIPEKYLDRIKNNKTDFSVLTLDVLAHAIGRGPEYISLMRHGHKDISRGTMQALDLLHARVHDRPELAVRAVEDHFERVGK